MSVRAALVGVLTLCAAPVSAQVWDVPLDTLQARVERQPGSDSARRALADRLVGEGALDAAVPHLRQLVADGPEFPVRRLKLARVLSWLGRSAEAIEAYEALLAIDGEHGEAPLELAKLLTWNGGAERAVGLLEPLATRQPDNAEVQNAYAYALHAAEQSEEARRQYDRALRLSPDDPQLLAESGTLERWEGDWVVGQRRLRRALDLNLEGEAAGRVQTVLDGLWRDTAPSVEVGIERSTDSNGLARTRFPSHTQVQFAPAWSLGVRISQERLEQTFAVNSSVIDAAATFVSPYLTFSPSPRVSVRGYLGLQDIHTVGSGVSGTLEAVWRQTEPRYLTVLGRVQSEAGVDGVRALVDGVRVTVATVEGYSEPLAEVALGLSLKGTSYSDGNARYEVSSSTRVGLTSLGPVKIGLMGGAGYEDTADIYAGSDPYWTPNDLLTVLGGGVLTFKPVSGVQIEPEVYSTFQRNPSVQSLSLGFRIRATVDRGRHRAGLLAEQSGSDAYSVKRFGLRYEVALW